MKLKTSECAGALAWRSADSLARSLSRPATATENLYVAFFEDQQGAAVLKARVIKTPVRAPRANAFAERVVRTIRGEVLDWTLVLGRRHLDRILRCYERHYNEQRPHRGLDLAVPDGRVQAPTGLLDRIERTDILGGLIHEYHAVAA